MMKILRYMMLVIMLLTCVIVSAQNKIEYLDGSRSFILNFKYGRAKSDVMDGKFVRSDVSITFISSDSYRNAGSFTINVKDSGKYNFDVFDIKSAVIYGELLYTGKAVEGTGFYAWNYDNFICIEDEATLVFTNSLNGWKR